MIRAIDHATFERLASLLEAKRPGEWRRAIEVDDVPGWIVDDEEAALRLIATLEEPEPADEPAIISPPARADRPRKEPLRSFQTLAKAMEYSSALTGEKFGWIVHRSPHSFNVAHEVQMHPEDGPVVVDGYDVIDVDDSDEIFATREEALEAHLGR